MLYLFSQINLNTQVLFFLNFVPIFSKAKEKSYIYIYQCSVNSHKYTNVSASSLLQGEKLQYNLISALFFFCTDTIGYRYNILWT